MKYIFLILFLVFSFPVHAGPGGCSTPCTDICVTDEEAARALYRCSEKAADICYKKHGACRRNAGGQCEWKGSAKLAECLQNPAAEPAIASPAKPAPKAPPTLQCEVGGCGGQLCLPRSQLPVATTCEWQESYGCYQKFSRCGPQRAADGRMFCGWQPTPALEGCLRQTSIPAPIPQLQPAPQPAAPVRNIP